MHYNVELQATAQTLRGGRNRGVNLPSPYFLSKFLPPPYFFEPISPSFLNGYVSFSPFALLFPHISPSSQLFLGHFSLLPILFLPPPLKATKYSSDYTYSYLPCYFKSEQR